MVNISKRTPNYRACPPEIRASIRFGSLPLSLEPSAPLVLVTQLVTSPLGSGTVNSVELVGRYA